MNTILLVILILLLVGAIPAWGNREVWGPAPFGGALGLILIILLILLLV